MAHQSLRGMRLYEAEWQRDGKSVGRLYIPAANDADALAQAENFFADFPHLDFRRGRASLTVKIRIMHVGLIVAEDFSRPGPERSHSKKTVLQRGHPRHTFQPGPDGDGVRGPLNSARKGSGFSNVAELNTKAAAQVDQYPEPKRRRWAH
jgi:hypothetical protein